MPLTNYQQYKVTIKTHPSFWEDFPDDAKDELEHELRRQHPGIKVRFCPVREHAKEDDTTGPDPDIVREIDGFYDWTIQMLG